MPEADASLMRQPKPTRGNGLLERMLAWLRSRKANALIPDALREGRVLDIGCGASAYFLSHAYFKEKHGLDQLARSPECRSDVLWHTLDLNGVSDLPFASEFFSTITMLAVVEHLNPDSLVALFREIHRTLKPGGVLIITTPAASTAALLRGLARLGLVSPEEIREHKFAYTLPLLGWYFGQAGFPREHVRFGRFEFGLNLWAVAQR